MRITAGFLFIFFTTLAYSQDLSEYQKEIFSTAKGEILYRVLYPRGFDPVQKYPLIIFLHGSFEKGNDNATQLNIGGRYFLSEENRQHFPAIIIFPQCPENDSWAYFDTKTDSMTGQVKEWDFPFRKEPTAATALLKNLLDTLRTRHFIDTSRIYIGGLSQGGMGVYDLCARYPGLFAAAFPICGAGKINTAKYFASQTAFWIFHGSDDEVVPVFFSREFYKRLKKLGADVKYYEYPGVHHNSWVNAFKEEDLLPWLFSKSKK